MSGVDWVSAGAGADWALAGAWTWTEAGTGVGGVTVAWNELEAVVEAVAGVLLTLAGVADLVLGGVEAGTGAGKGDLTLPGSASWDSHWLKVVSESPIGVRTGNEGLMGSEDLDLTRTGV